MTQQLTSNNTDKHLQIVHIRFPLLLKDLEQWIQAHPHPTAPQGISSQPLWFSQGAIDFVLQEYRPQALLNRLNQLKDDRQIVHFFHSVGHLLIFLGQDGVDKCLMHEKYQPWLMLPLKDASHVQQWVAKTPPRNWPWQLRNCELAEGDLVEAARRTEQELAALLNKSATSIVQHLHSVQYVNRPTPAQILREGKRPLRVLALAQKQSNYQRYCVRDVAESLQVCGVDAQFQLTDFPYDVLHLIKTFDPDVLFRLSCGRQDESFGKMPHGLAIVSWDQDYGLINTSQYALSAGPRDLLMVLMAEWREEAIAHQVPNSRVHHLNMGTNEKLYHVPKQRSAPQYDVLFVGNYYPFDQYKQVIGFGDLKPHVQELMVAGRDRLQKWIVNRGPDEPMVIPDCFDFLQKVLAQIKPGNRLERGKHLRLANFFRYRIAHLLVRELYVKRLAQWRLGLFGKGWEQVPEVAHLAKPPIENGKPLVDAIHRSAINIHLHTWTIHHPRLYDTAAAGGFLLVGNVPEQNPISSVFTVGEHVDTFGSIPDLERKIHYWLENPRERVAMADRASQHVRNEHTMTKRMEQMISFLKTEEQVDCVLSD